MEIEKGFKKKLIDARNISKHHKTYSDYDLSKNSLGYIFDEDEFIEPDKRLKELKEKGIFPGAHTDDIILRTKYAKIEIDKYIHDSYKTLKIDEMQKGIKQIIYVIMGLRDKPAEELTKDSYGILEKFVKGREESESKDE